MAKTPRRGLPSGRPDRHFPDWGWPRIFRESIDRDCADPGVSFRSGGSICRNDLAQRASVGWLWGYGL